MASKNILKQHLKKKKKQRLSQDLKNENDGEWRRLRSLNIRNVNDAVLVERT